MFVNLLQTWFFGKKFFLQFADLCHSAGETASGQVALTVER